MIYVLGKILTFLKYFEKVLAGLCFGGLTILMGLDVGGREIFNSGIEWAQKAAILLMIWGGFLGAALTSGEGGHLRPEIADKLWPKSAHNFQKGLEHFLIGMFCLFFLYLSYVHVSEAKNFGDIHPVIELLPLWVVKTIFPYTFMAMAFRHLIYSFIPSLRPATKNEATDALAEIQNGGKA
ncbi:TRAP transporter small permease [Leptospira sp. WS58.C1]|uniref:TRAP transporter small permease n=1 Tax=Leptospira cinconiae TaxID=3235173 RepID=UPI00349EBFA1